MKNVIIVGGGIAGLSAGIYARRSGFDATILEMHNIPGGNSTSWKRKGYLFEGGMHWLVGSSPKAPLHRIWKETGALREDTPIYNRDPFFSYLYGEQLICLYRDAEKLQQHLISVSPQDAKMIRSLCSDIRKFGKVAMPIMDEKGVQVKHKSAPPLSMMFSVMGAMPRMAALSKISVEQYVRQFQHEGIRELLRNVVGQGEFAANSILFTLGGLAVGDCGYPKGGSLQMARNMADCFEELGGRIQYNKRVERVLVRDGRAVGVLAEGEEMLADAVIMTADTRSAIDHLFETPLREPWMEEMRQKTIPLLCTFLCFGVRADLSDMPENFLFEVDEPLEFAGERISCMGINQYANFEGYAPQGCTSITVFLGGDTYDYWKNARQDGSYAQKKQQLAEDVMARLSKRFPVMRDQFEVWDVATPLTYERYCGTYKGSWMSVMKANEKQRSYPKRCEIAGLYFAGQRMMLPGGLPVAVSTGRSAVQCLCGDVGAMFEGECC